MKHARLVFTLVAVAGVVSLVFSCVSPRPAARVIVAMSDVTSGPLSAGMDRKATSETPPFLVLTGEDNRRDVSLAFTEFVWRARGDASDAYMITDGLKLGLQPGGTRAATEANLEHLIQLLGAGWWKKLASGYVICFNTNLPPNAAVTTLQQSIPPAVLMSRDFRQSVDLLREVTSLGFEISATNFISVVRESDVSGSRAESNQRQFHFSTRQATRVGEFVSEFSTFHGCSAHVRGNSIVIQDPDRERLGTMVDDVVQKFRMKGQAYPYPWNYTLPRTAAAELVRYLGDPDENTIQQVIITLLALNQNVGRPELFQIVTNGSRSKLTRAMAAKALAQMQVEEVLPYFKELSSAEFMLEEMIIAAGWVHTQKGLETQQQLIRSHQPLRASYATGKLDPNSLPPSVSGGDAEAMLRNAVGVANLFARSSHPRMLSTTLTISANGTEAACTLTKGYHRGPLNAAGDGFVIQFRKHNGLWFVVGAWDDGSWVS